MVSPNDIDEMRKRLADRLRRKIVAKCPVCGSYMAATALGTTCPNKCHDA